MTPRSESAAGRRDRLVTIEKRTGVSSGYPIETWVALTTAWMARNDATADERFVASQAQEQAYQTTVWHMPYLPEMDPDLVDVPATRRLVYAGRTYNIRSAARAPGLDTVTLVTLADTTVN